MSSVQIRALREADLPSALNLSTSVGWNQTAADWCRMLHLEPDGCFAAELAGQVVGTMLCCTFGSVAWLAMVIVQSEHRGQGLGGRLVRHGLEFAERCGIDSIRLDATPLGESVYRPLGFSPQFELNRMGGTVVVPENFRPDAAAAPEFAEPSDIAGLLRMDRLATRTDRSKLLSRLFQESRPQVIRASGGQVTAFLASRQGRLTVQLGPCAGEPAASENLFRQALARMSDRCVIADIPSDNGALLAIARDFGLGPQRTLLRMCYGPTVEEDREFFQISYGGEFG